MSNLLRYKGLQPANVVSREWLSEQDTSFIKTTLYPSATDGESWEWELRISDGSKVVYFDGWDDESGNLLDRLISELEDLRAKLTPMVVPDSDPTD